tara:strand:- start:5152 stop:5574 length:423 start_codon:yes stop_codon:yes gene_type:complete
MATLTTKITESVTVNSKVYGATNTMSITGVNNVYETVVTIGTTAATAIDFVASAPTFGSVLEGDLKYLRITNTDASNGVNIIITLKGASDKYKQTIGPGKSYIITSDTISFDGGSAGFMEHIILDAVTADVECEFFLATA